MPTLFRPPVASLSALALVTALVALPAAEGRSREPLRVLPTGGLKVESAALLMSGQEGGTIPFAALPLPFPVSPGDPTGRARVPVVVEIDGTDLLAGQPDPLLRIEISLYALAGGDRVAASRLDTVEIDLEQLGAGVGESGVRYVGELALAPDSYRVRVLVRNTATGELGLRTLALTVPPADKTGAVLLPPAFTDPAPDLWITARPSAPSPLAALAPADPPSARPILAPDEEASLLVAGWRLGGDGLRMQIYRQADRVADLPVQIRERREGPDGLQIFAITFRPETLEPGEYDLRVTLPRAAGDPRGDAVSPTTRFVLFPGGSQGSVWAALNSRGQTPEIPVAHAAEPPPARRRKPDAQAVRRACRDAFALLAGGDPAAAAAAVRALETSLLTGPGRAAGEDLTEIEVDLVRRLAARHPAIVEPVFLLHQRLYRDAAAAHDYLLMNQARQTALQLADLHAALHKTPEGRARTARLVLALAADLLKTAPPGMRERTYLRILDLDPDNQEALLCRAVDLERQGRYQDALEPLVHLLRAHPEHGEGRLRLAIDRLRLGHTREGKRLLEELAQAPPDQLASLGPAVVVLAAQELVRLLIDRDELEEAERAARAGLARFPDDEKLRLQLALLQDLRHDSQGARETLRPLEQRSGPAEPETARHRYNALPLERLARLRDELEAGHAAALADLAAALQEVTP